MSDCISFWNILQANFSSEGRWKELDFVPQNQGWRVVVEGEEKGNMNRKAVITIPCIPELLLPSQQT